MDAGSAVIDWCWPVCCWSGRLAMVRVKVFLVWRKLLDLLFILGCLDESACAFVAGRIPYLGDFRGIFGALKGLNIPNYGDFEFFS